MFDRVTWIGAAGWYHLLVLGLAIPYLAFRSAPKLRDRKLPPPDRLGHFRVTQPWPGSARRSPGAVSSRSSSRTSCADRSSPC
jgi:hypothetical protein